MPVEPLLRGEFPRVYVILDAETLDRVGMGLVDAALRMRDAGVRLLQLRVKGRDRERVLADTRGLVEALAGSGCQLILNDYADLVGPGGCAGVHVGQGDLDAAAARRVVGAGTMLGVSTHTEAEMKAAAAGPADYVAIGPVFRTRTKADAAPEVGLAGVRMARGLTGKLLVAIGGISVANARSVIEAGADCVAVVGAVFGVGGDAGERARRLLEEVAD